jgi:MFS family permease
MTAAAAAPGVPGWWPRRVYYGWALVWTLGVTATASYGVLLYALAAFVAPMGAELGWSTARITGAFSLAQLVAGAAAVPAGRWVDRHGARALMTAGSALAALALAAWSLVESVAAFYALFALLGVAMAGVLYEPAFAVVATWFRRGRSRALTLLTFLGGFASVVFVPLATVLVERVGWRDALRWLAALYALLTVPAHALLLRRAPADLGLAPDGDGPRSGRSTRARASRRARRCGAGRSGGWPSRSRSPGWRRRRCPSTLCRCCSSAATARRSPAGRWARSG